MKKIIVYALALCGLMAACEKEKEPVMVTFSYYGTTIQVAALTDTVAPVSVLTDENIADAVEKMDSIGQNMLADCLRIKEELDFGDWAYFTMLDSLAAACFPNDSNLSVLLKYSIYANSGYMARIGKRDKDLVVLFGSDQTLYSKVGFLLDGQKYYMVDSVKDGLRATNVIGKGNKKLSLALQKVPKLEVSESNTRKIRWNREGEDSTQVMKLTANINLLRFFDNYPSVADSSDFMTRWKILAETPFSDHLKSQLDQQITALTEGLSKKEIVAKLLYMIQVGLQYNFDDDVWGYDRAFFPEETLYYPYCDAEDRAILLARLVHDYTGLKTILIYYPGHLATGVALDEQEIGDYIICDGEKYIVCDPTFIAAEMGRTMTGMDNRQATVIKVN